MGLVPTTTYQTISFCYPSEKRDDGQIRVTFALDVRNNVGIGLSGGGVWKGTAIIGSFDGFIGFAHNVHGDDAAAVDALLHNLSQDLHDAYGVPLPDDGVPEEPETSGSGEGAE